MCLVEYILERRINTNITMKLPYKIEKIFANFNSSVINFKIILLWSSTFKAESANSNLYLSELKNKNNNSLFCHSPDPLPEEYNFSLSLQYFWHFDSAYILLIITAWHLEGIL